MLHWLEIAFGGDVPKEPLELYQVAARAVLVYFVGVFVVRIGKSRLVGRMTSVDVLVGFILGSLLSRGITGHASLSGTAVASAGVIASHWAVTWLTCHSHALGCLLKGDAELLVRDGQPLLENMRHAHISLHELTEALRLAGVADVREVREAYRERNGEISVLKVEP
jgi:uncharacterized membrane protein YcaP (DUF421 family)